MSSPLVTVNLVVLNGEKYIRRCLDGILAQTYEHGKVEINILDNNSIDGTKSIINSSKFKVQNSKFVRFNFVESKLNLGMWPGQEELLRHSNGKYILAMAVDVILDKNFVKNAVEIMEKDEKTGALQAKIYKYDISDLQSTIYNPQSTIIDTCGFQIERSRRITNIGHGEEDVGQFGGQKNIFGVEGACPFFRREALESCRIEVQTQRNIKIEPQYEIFDHDYFWYGDDLDLAWRMNLFGWKQIFAPSVIAWHDRQTTKTVRKGWLDYILRVSIRYQIPIKKRRLDWRNIRFTIIKNDYIINIWRDLPAIMIREIQVLAYTFIFEPKVFLEYPSFFKLLPQMICKRKEIMKKAKVSSNEIRKWFK